MKNRNYISLGLLILLAYLFIRVGSFYPRYENAATEATLSWDVFGYYLYLPSYFIYDDLGGLGFIEEVFDKYHPAADFHAAVKQPNGNYVMKYPMGMSVIYSPFFFAGHGYALASDYPADGFSRPYQFAIWLGCIIYALLGLAILRKVLLRYVSDLSTAITLLIIAMGTNYLNYVSFDGAMTHNALFTIFAAILYLTISWHEAPSWKKALGIGLLAGLAALARPTEVIILLVPVLWGVMDKESLLAKGKLLWEHKTQVLILGAALAFMGSWQLIYWKIYSGNLLYYSYEDQGFTWLWGHHIFDGLFSYRKGWFAYTPVMILSLIGFLPLFKSDKKIFWPILAFSLLNLYIIFAWDIWWYGGSFGARPLIQSYSLLAIPLAYLIQYLIQSKKRILQILTLVFVILCIDLNAIMTWQAHTRAGIWEAEYMTKAYYWKIFGSTNPQKADKIFLDVRHELEDTDGMEVKEVFFNDFEKDSLNLTTDRHVFEGSKALLMNKETQYSQSFISALGTLTDKEESWVRVSCRGFYTQMQWNVWAQTQMVTQFIRDGKVYRATAARLQRTTDAWRWHDFHYEMKFPRNWKEGDELKVYFWNAESDTEAFIDNLKVEVISPAD